MQHEDDDYPPSYQYTQAESDREVNLEVTVRAKPGKQLGFRSTATKEAYKRARKLRPKHTS